MLILRQTKRSQTLDHDPSLSLSLLAALFYNMIALELYHKTGITLTIRKYKLQFLQVTFSKLFR